MTQILSVMSDGAGYVAERALCGSPSVYKYGSLLYFCRETHDLSLIFAASGRLTSPAGCSSDHRWNVLLHRGLSTC